MSDFLLKFFIKDTDYLNVKTKEKVGTLSSIVGIVCNIFLFGLKFLIGTLSSSISIISDGFNNLSDCMSCVVTLFGYKMAAKPADKDHPFGHGRIEYLTSLLIAFVILFVGLELFKGAIDKILNPVAIEFSWFIAISLIFSIILKLWMGKFNQNLGNKCKSTIMLATAQDSYSDTLATFAALISLFLSQFTDWPVDGFIGIIVSLFVINAGYGIIKNTIDILIGKSADSELVENICELIKGNSEILGIHDLIIHSYGSSTLLGSVHVEVCANSDFVMIHDIVDCIEKDIYDKFKVIMTIHMDPMEQDNPYVNDLKNKLVLILKEIDLGLTYHDFRIVPGNTHTNVIFDVVVPFKCCLDDIDIKDILDKRFNDSDTQFYLVVTFDRLYH